MSKSDIFRPRTITSESRPMRFTLRQLEYFVSLSDQKTLSAAAAVLHISESALSHAITELEKSVGTQLCLRQKAKGITLTPVGRHFAERARKILLEATNLSLEVSSSGNVMRGPVHLGCFSGIANNILPSLLDGIAKEYPGLDVQLTVGTHAELLPALVSGKIDTAILYDMFLPPNLGLQQIYRTEVTVAIPEGHRLSECEAIILTDLQDDPFILVDSKPSTDNTSLIFRESGISPNLFAAVPSVELAKALVGRGLGYSLLMSRPNSTGLTTEGRRIVIRPLQPKSGETRVVAVWPKKFPISPRAKVVIDLAASLLGSF